MKTFLFLLMVVTTVCFQSTAYADANSPNGVNGSNPTTSHGRRGGGKRLTPGTAEKNPGTIRGTCSIAESVSNPLPGPCITLLLILNDADGNEVVKTRTTTQGLFDFAAEQGKAYNIVSGSKSYEIIAPKALVHGGDKIDLRLQQK